MQDKIIEIHIKQISGSTISLRVPLDIKVRSLIKQLKEVPQAQLTDSDYYLEKPDGIKLENEVTLSEAGIEDDNTLIIREKREVNDRKRFPKLVIAISVAVLIFSSLGFWYLISKNSTNERQSAATIHTPNEQVASGSGNDDQSPSRESLNEEGARLNQENPPALDEKPAKKDTDVTAQEPFVIQFDIPSSEIETETRVLVKLVKDRSQSILFHLESPFYRAEKGPVGQNVMPSLVWVSGAVHVYSGEHVSSPGKVKNSGNDMRIAEHGQMVVVLQKGDIVKNNLLENWQINSDSSYPIIYKIVKHQGYVYMCGRGTITSPSGKVFELGKDDTSDKWLELLGSSDSLKRESAAVALGYLGDSQSVSKLINALNDPHPLVRRSAAESLGRIGDKTAIPALQTVIVDKHTWTVETAKWAIEKTKLTDDNSLIAKGDSKTEAEIQISKSLPKQSQNKKVDHALEVDNKGSNEQDQGIRQEEEQVTVEKKKNESENVEQKKTPVSHNRVAKHDTSSSAEIDTQTASKNKIDNELEKAEVEENIAASNENDTKEVSNHSPTIDAINIASADHILPGKQVEIRVQSSDPDSDALMYTWKADKSYFLSDKTIKPVNYWVAPFDKGKFTITVGINDQRGGHSQKERTISVMNSGLENDLGDYNLLRVFENNIEAEVASRVLDIDFDSENNMYVLEPERRCIQVYGPNGRYTKTLCKGSLVSPNEILIKDDKIYVIYNNWSVERFSLSGNLELNYNEKKTNKYSSNVLKRPVSLAVGIEDELYVIDGALSNINVFEKDGRFRRRFGKDENITLINPVAISIDKDGYVFVLDSETKSVFVYNPDLQYDRIIKLSEGRFDDMYYDKNNDMLYLLNGKKKSILVTDTFGDFKNEHGKLRAPYKIKMDRFKNIYVTNKIDNYINKFSYSEKDNAHKYYGKFGTNPFADITSIAAGKDSSIFLLNEKINKTIKIDRNGWELERFGSKVTENVKVIKPVSIITGKDGEYIYVLEKYKKQELEFYKRRVLQYTDSGEFIRIVVDQENGRINKPIDIGSNSEGDLYVLCGKDDVCYVYDHMGEYKTQIGTKEEKKYIKDILPKI